MNRREFLLAGVAAFAASTVTLSAPTLKAPFSTRRERDLIVYRFSLPLSLEPAETHKLVTLLHAQTALEIQRYGFVVNALCDAGPATQQFLYQEEEPWYMKAGDSLHCTFTAHSPYGEPKIPFSIHSGVFAVYARQQSAHVRGLVRA